MSNTSKRRATRAKQVAELDERLGPDRSGVVHVFDDGWTVRLIDTPEDTEREGVLMHLCLRRREEREMHMRSTRIMRELHEDHRARGLDFSIPYLGWLLSLRDQHNHPHVTFTADEHSVYEIEGNGGGKPKPAYLQRIRDYVAAANPTAEIIVESHSHAGRSNEAMHAWLDNGETPSPSTAIPTGPSHERVAAGRS